jgi:hypothetical protein
VPELDENQHVIGSARTMIDLLAPLNGKKSLTLGGSLSLLVGAIEVGMCFRCRKAPLICILRYLGGSIAIPGLAALPGWLLVVGYGIYRAYRASESPSHL